MEEFLKAILQAEDKMRGKVETHKPILMQNQDWIDFKEATHSHICEKALRGSLPNSVTLDFGLEKTFALYFYHQHYYPS